MRERSTWNLKEIAKKAAKKQAAEVAGDIYSMNQDHPQPAMDEYVIGDPSDFAEDVHEPNTWDVEYSGGAVKRNEIGMPEMRGDTFNHAEKTASETVRLKKAELCVAVAKMMLKGKKIASAETIEDQAYGLMYMPDQELINTHKRLAAEQEQDADESDDDSDESQDKQAGEIPEAFKENIEKMKAKSEDKKDDGDKDQGEKKEAGEMPDFIKEKIEEKKDDKKEDDGEKKEAADSKKSDEDLKEPKNEGGDQNSAANANKQATDQIAQMQQMMAQMQQMLQMAQQQQQAPVQAPAMSQGDELDQMLASDSCGPMAEVDIEMEPSPMDVDNVVLAGDDEILRTLFADDQQVEEEQVQQVQEKQAAVRTASTRTVGTRPTEGVSKLGGSVSKTAAAAQEDRLSSLWATAPDVRDAFGLK